MQVCTNPAAVLGKGKSVEIGTHDALIALGSVHAKLAAFQFEAATIQNDK